MTRINLIDPKLLADQHCHAEHREIVRIPTLLRDTLNKKSRNEINRSIPSEYTMGQGHVKFFLDKMGFLHDRHVALTEELHLRGYNLNDTKTSEEIFLQGIDKEFCLVYNPDKKAVKTNVERILTRIEEKESFYKFMKEPCPVGFFRQIYTTNNLI
jgi:deoxyribonuclease (pyrimidine dimer)